MVYRVMLFDRATFGRFLALPGDTELLTGALDGTLK